MLFFSIWVVDTLLISPNSSIRSCRRPLPEDWITDICLLVFHLKLIWTCMFCTSDLCTLCVISPSCLLGKLPSWCFPAPPWELPGIKAALCCRSEPLCGSMLRWRALLKGSWAKLLREQKSSTRPARIQTGKNLEFCELLCQGNSINLVKPCLAQLINYMSPLVNLANAVSYSFLCIKNIVSVCPAVLQYCSMLCDKWCQISCTDQWSTLICSFTPVQKASDGLKHSSVHQLHLTGMTSARLPLITFVAQYESAVGKCHDRSAGLKTNRQSFKGHTKVSTCFDPQSIPWCFRMFKMFLSSSSF